jgi:hypothetical protein
LQSNGVRTTDRPMRSHANGRGSTPCKRAARACASPKHRLLSSSVFLPFFFPPSFPFAFRSPSFHGFASCWRRVVIRHPSFFPSSFSFLLPSSSCFSLVCARCWTPVTGAAVSTAHHSGPVPSGDWTRFSRFVVAV